MEWGLSKIPCCANVGITGEKAIYELNGIQAAGNMEERVLVAVQIL